MQIIVIRGIQCLSGVGYTISRGVTWVYIHDKGCSGLGTLIVGIVHIPFQRHCIIVLILCQKSSSEILQL